MNKDNKSAEADNTDKKLHTMSAYAVAQLTMGHELIFSCLCGEKIALEPF